MAAASPSQVEVLRGDALIFNHYQYDASLKLSTRHGTSTDTHSLQETLTGIGLKVEINTDLPFGEIKKRLENHASESKNCDCLFVFVLTHGKEGGKLYAYDKEYSTSELWQPYVQRNALAGKPKVFVIVANRGHNVEAFVEPNTDLRQEMKDISYAQPRVPSKPYYVFAYSTIENFTSIRNSVDGTWYINEFCNQLKEMTEPTDLLDLLTKVNLGVNLRGSTDFHNRKLVQTPIFHSFLREEFLIPNVSSHCTESETQAAKYTETVSLPCYNLEGKGLAIILYLLEFYEIAEKFQRLFNDRCLKKIEILKIMDYNSTKKNLERIKDELEDETGCIVIVLAHMSKSLKCGLYEDTILFDGGSVPVSHIWMHFTGLNCPKLVKKPKIFFYIDVIADQAGLGTLELHQTSSTDPSKYQVSTFTPYKSSTEKHSSKSAVLDATDTTMKDKGVENELPANDHADMCHVFGQGREFYSAVLQELQEAHPWDILKLFRHNFKANDNSHFYPHVQSTLLHPCIYTSLDTSTDYHHRQELSKQTRSQETKSKLGDFTCVEKLTLLQEETKMQGQKRNLKDPRYKYPGCVLVFNQYKFDDPDIKTRYFTEHDVKYLQCTFETNFQFKVFHDKTRQEIRDILRKIADSENPTSDEDWVDLKDCASLIVVILTHGSSSGVIYAKDGQFHVSELWNPFINCEALRGKLKWFIIQACRTEEEKWDFILGARYLPTFLIQESVDRRTYHQNLPRMPHTLISYNTVEDRIAKRSRFISTLCRELGNWDHDNGLLSVLTRTNQRVIDEHKTEIDGPTPTFTSFLSNDFYCKLDVTPIIPSYIESLNERFELTDSSSVHNASRNLKLIEADTAGGSIQKILDCYPWDGVKDVIYAGEAFILHDVDHKIEAEKLADIARNKMKLTPVLEQITSDIAAKDFIVSKKDEDFKAEACVVFMVLAKLDETRHFTEIFDEITKAFLGTSCGTLASKPKCFFFLDKATEQPETIVCPDSPLDSLEFSSQHSDMFFLRSRGNEFLENFITTLDEKCRELNILSLVTKVIGTSYKSDLIEGRDLLPHVVSTLRFRLVYNSNQEELIDPKNKKTTKYAGIKESTSNFVGRKKELEKIYQVLKEEKEDIKMVDLAILGELGIGKTEIMLHFVNSYIKGDTPCTDDGVSREPLKIVWDRKALNDLKYKYLWSKKSLIIIDDFTKDLDIFATLGDEGNEHLKNIYIVVLSREDRIQIAKETIRLQGLEDEDAAELCLKYHPESAYENDKDMLKEFTNTFGNHPLALEIASKYTKENYELSSMFYCDSHDFPETKHLFDNDEQCVLKDESGIMTVQSTENYGDIDSAKWDQICNVIRKLKEK